MERAARSIALPVALLVGAACTRGPARPIAPGAPIVAVLAPTGGENDSLGSLVDGTIDRTGWYCSSAHPPLRFEVMTADGEARSIQAVGFVAANLGPDGVGPVTVRVQVGHGVMAAGRAFGATVAARSNELVVLELPEPVVGDHVVLGWLRGSAWRTAVCLGEIVVYDAAHPAPSRATRVGLSVASAPAEPAATLDASSARDVVDASADGTAED